MRIADTTFLVDLLRGRESASAKLDEMAEVSSTLLVPAPVVHELFYGASKADEPEEERARLRDILDPLLVVPLTPEEAGTAGRLDAELELDGTPIDSFDVQIASAALARDAPVVSRDDHFHRVPGLDVEPY